MPRKATALTAIKVRAASPGRYGDGNGLFLLVRPIGLYWLFRYRTGNGRMREMGLGPAGEGKGQVSLTDARKAASPLWTAVKAGIDPLERRRSDMAAERS